MTIKALTLLLGPVFLTTHHFGAQQISYRLREEHLIAPRPHAQQVEILSPQQRICYGMANHFNSHLTSVFFSFFPSLRPSSPPPVAPLEPIRQSDDSLISFMLTGNFTEDAGKYSLDRIEEMLFSPSTEKKAAIDLEYGHEFIQTYFPKDEPSWMQWFTPYLNPKRMLLVQSFNGEEKKAVQKTLRRAFGVMMRFYGFEYRPNQIPLVTQGESDFAKERLVARWAHDHNKLRITRILHSLNLFGLHEEAASFFGQLQELPFINTPDLTTMTYWESAMEVKPFPEFQNLKK